MLSTESQKFFKEFIDDEKYEGFVEELKQEDEMLGSKFEGIMDKVYGICEIENSGSQEENEDDEEDNQKEMMNKKGREGLAIYIGKIAAKQRRL